METIYLVDTNVLLSTPQVIHEYQTVIPSCILREIEHLERTRKMDTVLQWNIRGAKREMERAIDLDTSTFYDLDDVTFTLRDEWDGNYTDNVIIQLCVDKGYGLLTNDRLLKLKAELYDIPVMNPIHPSTTNHQESYQGFKEVEMTTQEFQSFYNERIHLNEFDLLPNQYLIITHPDTNQPTAMKFDGTYYVDIKQKKVRSAYMGDFVAKDVYQACAIDSLVSNTITLLRGKAGTAKTLASLTYAMNQLETGKADKLVVFTNSVPTKNAQYLGMNKGSLHDKLMQVSIGHILASKLGGYQVVEELMNEERLIVLPFSDIRGYDTSGMNAIVLITEAQNLDRELMKLAIQRVGEDCKLIIEGDNDTQLDLPAFEGNNNGMRAVSEVFRGEAVYGEIELQTIYRSRIAELAERLTESVFA